MREWAATPLPPGCLATPPLTSILACRLPFPAFFPQSFQVEEVVDEMFRPTRAAQEGASYLWRTARERATWLSDVASATTAARLAYSAAVLAVQARPLLATLHRERGGKQQQQRGSGKAGKPASHEPPAAPKDGKQAADGKLSRNNSSTALLEAARGGRQAPGARGGGGGGTKRSVERPPVAENARVTRARS